MGAVLYGFTAMHICRFSIVKQIMQEREKSGHPYPVLSPGITG